MSRSELKEDLIAEEQPSAVRIYGTATGTTDTTSHSAVHSSGSDATNEPHVTDSSALLDERIAHDTRYPLDAESANIHRRRGLHNDCCDWSKPCGSWLKHPKVKEQWKVVLASFALTVLGLALIVAGFVFIAIPDTHVSSYVFLIAGFICFIPGAYHFVHIYLSVTGRCGFSLYNMPVYK